MKKLTTEQSFEYYLSSLCMLGLHTINLSDEEIEYEIFEELAIDYPAALSPYTRELLVDNDIIDRELSLLSKQLQTKLLNLMEEFCGKSIENNARMERGFTII